MKSQLKQEALLFLDDLYENLPEEKSGEELLNRMEWKIRQHEGALYTAIIHALGEWLRGPDQVKAEYAIDLIGRLGAVQYLPELEKILSNMHANNSHLPSYWKSFVQGVIDKLNKKL